MLPFKFPWPWTSGYKTYYVAAGMIVVSGLHAQGYIDEATYRWLEGVLLGGGLVTLRQGVKKVG